MMKASLLDGPRLQAGCSALSFSSTPPSVIPAVRFAPFHWSGLSAADKDKDREGGGRFEAWRLLAWIMKGRMRG